MVCGVHLIGQFLQRFARDSSSSPDARSTSNPALTPNSNSSSTMIIIMGEVEVETAAMVLAQLSTELGVLSLLFSSDRPEGDYADMTLTESVTQLCIWLRLLGSGSSSGLVSVAEVISLLEDRWMKGEQLFHVSAAGFTNSNDAMRRAGEYEYVIQLFNFECIYCRGELAP